MEADFEGASHVEFRRCESHRKGLSVNNRRKRVVLFGRGSIWLDEIVSSGWYSSSFLSGRVQIDLCIADRLETGGVAGWMNRSCICLGVRARRKIGLCGLIGLSAGTDGGGSPSTVVAKE